MRKIISKVSKTVKNLAKKAAEKVNLFLVASIMAFGSVFPQAANAQTLAGTGYDAGTSALETVATELTKYIPYVVNLCYALAGIVAIVGAVSVYIAMKKKIMLTVGACIFLIAAANALPLFFGITN